MNEFKEALIHSKIISWDQHFIFAAIDDKLAHLIHEVIVRVTGKEPTSCKNNMYYITPNEGQHFEQQ
jgi:hypothetical protein